MAPGGNEAPPEQFAARAALAVGCERQHVVARRHVVAPANLDRLRDRKPRPEVGRISARKRVAAAHGLLSAPGDLLGPFGLGPLLATAPEVRQRAERDQHEQDPVEDRHVDGQAAEWLGDPVDDPERDREHRDDQDERQQNPADPGQHARAGGRRNQAE